MRWMVRVSHSPNFCERSASMNGRDKSVNASWTILLVVLVAFAGTVQAAEVKHKGKPFRFGITADPGFKPLNEPDGQINVGLVFKFKEKLSLIPQVGYFP